jgi:hypothetical protein
MRDKTTGWLTVAFMILVVVIVVVQVYVAWHFLHKYW